MMHKKMICTLMFLSVGFGQILAMNAKKPNRFWSGASIKPVEPLLGTLDNQNELSLQELHEIFEQFMNTVVNVPGFQNSSNKLTMTVKNLWKRLNLNSLKKGLNQTFLQPEILPIINSLKAKLINDKSNAKDKFNDITEKITLENFLDNIHIKDELVRLGVEIYKARYSEKKQEADLPAINTETAVAILNQDGSKKVTPKIIESALEILGFNEDDLREAITISDILSAYRRAALKAHPDKGGSTEAMQAVSRAKEILTDIADDSSTPGTIQADELRLLMEAGTSESDPISSDSSRSDSDAGSDLDAKEVISNAFLQRVQTDGAKLAQILLNRKITKVTESNLNAALKRSNIMIWGLEQDSEKMAYLMGYVQNCVVMLNKINKKVNPDKMLRRTLEVLQTLKESKPARA